MRRLIPVYIMALLILGSTIASVSIPDGGISIVGDGAGWPHEYGGGTYHSPEMDLTTLNSGNAVALRGWVDISQTLAPDAGGNAKYYFGWHFIDMDFETNGWASRQEIKTNFTTANLGSWHGIPAQPWDRIRLESTNLAVPSGEEWYCTEGGTHDVAGGGTIYPTDQLYYFQTIIDPTTRNADLWVYGKGNPGDGTSPNWNNAVDDKQWYHISSYAISTDFDLSSVLVYPDLFSSPDAAVGSVSTVNWTGMEIGAPVSLTAAPPAIPEPATLALLGLGGLLLRKRKA